MIDLNKRVGRSAVCALIAATTLTTSVVVKPGFAAPRYDGLWSVSIVTENGDCDRGYRYPIRISNGHLANAGDAAFTISGRVVENGAITVVVSAAGKTAAGSGRLSGDIGEGSWTGGACSGSWSAERRGGA